MTAGLPVPRPTIEYESWQIHFAACLTEFLQLLSILGGAVFLFSMNYVPVGISPDRFFIADQIVNQLKFIG